MFFLAFLDFVLLQLVVSNSYDSLPRFFVKIGLRSPHP